MTKRILAVLLVLAMLVGCLCGCDNEKKSDPTTEATTEPTSEPTTEPTSEPTTEPTEPEPTWPVIEELSFPEFKLKFQMTDEDLTKCDELITLCEELSYNEEAPREIVEAAWDNLDDYLDYIMTQVSIAQVVYYQDMDDETKSQTYLDAYDDFLLLADRANLLQKRMYDDSPVKDWFFEDWSERDIRYLQNYQSEVIDLQARLNELEVEFQDIMETEQMYDGFVPLYIEYVTIGNQIAELSGYEDFFAFKSDLTYSRDYTAEDMETFYGLVKTYLVPNYESMSEPVYTTMDALSQGEYMTVAYFMSMDYDQQPTKNYLQEYINSFDNSTGDGFRHLFDNGYHIFSDDEGSYPGAFCTSFDTYDISYCYFGPGYQHTMTVTHEMGHYYASYYENDDAAFDLLETHSQANEALMLAFLKDHMSAGEYEFTKYYQLFNNATMILVCSMVADFEQRIYALDSLEGFTSADIDKIIDEVCEDYFGAYGGSTYVENNIVDLKSYIRQVAINSPCYYISYATSLVTTLNFYADAMEDMDAAREAYRKLAEEAWENTEGYVAALEYAGAANPFEESSFQTVIDLFAGPEPEGIEGTWIALTVDDQEDTRAFLESMEFYEEEIALIDLDSMKTSLKLQLNADGTYEMGVDVQGTEEAMGEFFDGMMKSLYVGRMSLAQIYGEELATMTRSQFDQYYAELFGLATYDEFRLAFIDSVDYESLAANPETGTYTVDGSEIHFTIDGTTESEYADFVLEDGKLTVTYSDTVVEYTRK